MVPLGYGKFVRADRVYALVPLEGAERGDGRRTLVYVEGIEQPLIASRSEAAIAGDLASSLEAAILAYPQTQAVLVRRHGFYAWGRDWVQAKTQAECYDYLFRAAAEMRRLGIPTVALKGVTDASLSSRPAEPFLRR